MCRDGHVDHHYARLRSWEDRLQSNDMIKVVTPLGGGISEITSFPDEATVLAGIAGILVERGRIFHAVVRHLSSAESDVSLIVRTVEIPLIGEDGEISGVLCRNLPLTSPSPPTPLTVYQGTAIIGEVAKGILRDITNLLATIDCGLWVLGKRK
jgi:hypothetical protein